MTKRPGAAVATSVGVATAAAAAAFVWGVVVERNRFTVRQEVLPILEPGARPLTILHLSDLHMAPWQRAKQEFIRSLARYEPDLVVDTGDNLGHEDGLLGIRRALEPFAGVPGVFVHGSNDYVGPEFKNPLAYFAGPSKRRPVRTNLDTEALTAYFEDGLGWWRLDNAARAIELRGTAIELFGTGDAHRGWDRLGDLPGTIEEMRESVEWSDDLGGQVLRIGITHAPYRRVLDAFTNHGAELLFAGHTHGGQVRVPGLPALVTNCDIPRDQAQGLSVWRGPRRSALLNVSAGIGTSIYAPFRFACPPEAVLITLLPAG